MQDSGSRLGEMIRFGVVGVGNTLVNFAVFALTIHLFSGLGRGGLVLANIVAFAVAVTHSYFWNSRWTFRRAGSPSRFLAVNLIGMQIDTLILAILTGFGVPVAVAKVLSTGAGVCWNYLGMRCFVFFRGTPERHFHLPELKPLTPEEIESLKEKKRDSTLSRVMEDLCKN